VLVASTPTQPQPAISFFSPSFCLWKPPRTRVYPHRCPPPLLTCHFPFSLIGVLFPYFDFSSCYNTSLLARRFVKFPPLLCVGASPYPPFPNPSPLKRSTSYTHALFFDIPFASNRLHKFPISHVFPSWSKNSPPDQKGPRPHTDLFPSSFAHALPPPSDVLFPA